MEVRTMRYHRLPLTESTAYRAVVENYRVDETLQVRRLLRTLQWSAPLRERIQQRARALVLQVRAQRRSGAGVDALMHEYQLSSQEGVVLMCLAEAMLRIPDTATVDLLIEDKLSLGDWERHLGHSDSAFVNASTWGLMLSGRLLETPLTEASSRPVLKRLLQRLGEPLVRQAVGQAMRIMARQFVMGRSIKEALKRAGAVESAIWRYSYDMLGEAARTDADAKRYLKAYQQAIEAVGLASEGLGPVKASGVSIKLSALHARFELSQAERVMRELLPRVLHLARLARHYNISLTIDAEEAERLDITMAVLESLALNPEIDDWQGLGLAVQAYQKRAFDLLDWLADLARRSGRRLMVRLVKGAYWDSEIKRTQELGLGGYPVFTRKAATDVSYLACATRMLANSDVFYCQFATHNAYTVAAILELCDQNDDFEFQRLHGMGGPLYDQLLKDRPDIACRVYAPVGSHEDLLPYLVRRLLENGANTSFVNRIMDDEAPLDELIAHPMDVIESVEQIPHPAIPLPVALYADRGNSTGLDLTDMRVLESVQDGWRQRPLPGRPDEATDVEIEHALSQGFAAFDAWNATPVEMRALTLERLAELLEAQLPRYLELCASEAGKTLADGVAEVREAVDFCRYYALRARADFAPRELPGPTGERNVWQLRGRGLFVCISPWNFPLAIFVGQVAAALVAGNSVIAKPAPQTPQIAALTVSLMYQAGIPHDVLHLAPGGSDVGAALVADERIGGVAFTGSTETARAINRTLAARQGAIVPLIAETGGLNAMVVDSSALLEQVVVDVLQSGFHSAGQRCSALRLLLVQDDVADNLLRLLTGAMDELVIGDPADLATDVGPVIDEAAHQRLLEHLRYLEGNAVCRKRCELPEGLESESAPHRFFPPCLYEISSLTQIEHEVFGPIVHVLRFAAEDLLQLMDALNAKGYGLTFAVHSRIDSRARQLASISKAGNVYINRNMVGAVVGVQPFGGQGLSGTGPKAGGPLYLTRFATEQSISTNTAAAGGNASLMSLSAT